MYYITCHMLRIYMYTLHVTCWNITCITSHVETLHVYLTCHMLRHYMYYITCHMLRRYMYYITCYMLRCYMYYITCYMLGRYMCYITCYMFGCYMCYITYTSVYYRGRIQSTSRLHLHLSTPRTGSEGATHGKIRIKTQTLTNSRECHMQNKQTNKQTKTTKNSKNKLISFTK